MFAYFPPTHLSQEVAVVCGSVDAIVTHLGAYCEQLCVLDQFYVRAPGGWEGKAHINKSRICTLILCGRCVKELDGTGG